MALGGEGALVFDWAKRKDTETGLWLPLSVLKHMDQHSQEAKLYPLSLSFGNSGYAIDSKA